MGGLPLFTTYDRKPLRMLGVLPSKLIRGCSSIQGDANLLYFQKHCQEVMPLEQMLSTQFRTDAHFTSYQLTCLSMWLRLNKSILPEIRQDGADIVLAYMTFDWDNVDHGEWTDELLAEFATLLNNCQDPIINSWSAIYTTAHGMRLIYTLSQPVPVDDGESHLAWMFHHFQENGFPLIDSGCKDWTRLMRCPQVMRDDKPTWEQGYYGMSLKESVLDISLVGKRSPKTVARKTYFIKDKQELPSFDILSKYLMAIDGASGRPKQTEYYKKAKKVLKTSEYVDVLFNDAVPMWEKGNRNDEIGRMLGHITPILLVGTNATVQQVYALAVHPILTLENDQEWVAHGWNALLDIYEREVNKLNWENEQVAENVSKEITLLNRMVEGMKEWCDAPELLADEETAREYARANCMASVQSYVYLMDEDGRYSSFAIGKDQIVSRVRRTHLNPIIKTSKVNYIGEEVDINAATMINNYSTPVAEVQMKPVGDGGGCIENLNGEFPILVQSTFCRNDDLEPAFDPFVNQWLVNLFGSHFDVGCDWIANALAFEEGLICALSMEGAGSSGKKLFTEGLSECLKVPYVAGPEAMYHQSSAFLHTPFLVVNESWPTMRGATSPADKFKSITGGDGIIVNEKFKPSVRVLCPVRLIMCANDDGIIRKLVDGKDMGIDNRTAVGERLYHFKVSIKAKLYLEGIGGRGHTAKPGARWIRPDSGNEKSDFIVAKHFLWLYQHRNKVDARQRFLVMGNCAPGAADGSRTVLDRVLSEGNNTPTIGRAIIGLVDTKASQWRQYLRLDHDMTHLWVTREGVYQYIRIVLEERVTETEVFSAMQNLLASPDPVEMEQVYWYEICVESLLEIATKQGIAKTLVRNIYMNKIQKESVAV